MCVRICLLIRDRKIWGRLTKYFEVLKRSRKGNIFFHYSSGTPSMGPWVMERIRLTSMAEFPFIKSRERREMAWLQTSLSSLPVCLAMAWAIFFTSVTATLCQPPRDSKARLRLCPWVTAASSTVACCRLMTVMSRALS